MTEAKRSLTGFTLLEVLLSVALIAIIAGLSVPVYQTFQVRNDLDIATTEIVQTARRAQTLSRAVQNDTSWGVAVATGTITLFQGATFATRNAAYDEVFDLPTTISPSGAKEISYLKFSGLPAVLGTITLTSSNNEVRNITINNQGTISY